MSNTNPAHREVVAALAERYELQTKGFGTFLREHLTDDLDLDDINWPVPDGWKFDGETLDVVEVEAAHPVSPRSMSLYRHVFDEICYANAWDWRFVVVSAYNPAFRVGARTEMAFCDRCLPQPGDRRCAILKLSAITEHWVII